MTLNAQMLEQVQTELAVARGNVASGQIDPAVSDDAKLIAAAIVQAGNQIALALSAD